MAERNSNTGNYKRKENLIDQVEDDNSVCDVGRDVLDFFHTRLNWNVVDSQQFKDCATSFLPQKKEYDTVKSHALKLIQSELVPFHGHAIKLPHLSEGDIVEKHFYVPGVDKDSHLVYPQFSSLTRKEQIQLFTLLYRKSDNLHVGYKELIEKALKEHKAFQDFVQREWIQHQCGRSLQISLEVQRFLDHLWQTRAKQCLNLYPTQYKQHSIIPLALNDPNNVKTEMEFKTFFFKEGGVPWKMRLPYTRKPCHLISQYDQLCRVKPVSVPGQADTAQPLATPSLPASIDPLVDLCLEKDHFDVIITCSGIKAIVDTYNTQDWILPVTVKNVLNVFGNTVKKVVIIDKKLPISAMSVHNKNVWHAKIASKWALITANFPHIFNVDVRSKVQPKTRSSSGERILTQYDDSLIEDETEEIEEFGVEKSSSSRNQNVLSKKSIPRFEKELKQDNESNCLTKDFQSFSFVPVLTKLDTKKPVTRLKESNLDSEKKDSKLTSVTNGSSSVESRMQRKRPHTDNLTPTPDQNQSRADSDSSPLKQMAQRSQGPNSRLIYKMWQLRKSSHYNMAKKEQRSLKILVRNRQDGRFGPKDVCVSSRLEFQPEFGATCLDKSHLVREYVDLFLRQFSELIRVRTVGHTGEVMLTELKTLADVKEALEREAVQWYKLFDPLYAVLTRLIDLSPGVYLLQHSARQGPFVNLLQHSEDGGWNLSSELSECRLVSANVPARRVDPHILTSIHHQHKVPPAIFPTAALKETVKPRFLKKLPKKKRQRKKSKKKPKSKTDNKTA